MPDEWLLAPIIDSANEFQITEEGPVIKNQTSGVTVPVFPPGKTIADILMVRSTIDRCSIGLNYKHARAKAWTIYTSHPDARFIIVVPGNKSGIPNAPQT